MEESWKNHGKIIEITWKIIEKSRINYEKSWKMMGK